MILDSNAAVITVHEDGCVELDTKFGMVLLSLKSQKEIYKEYLESDYKIEKERCKEEYEHEHKTKTV